MKFQSRRAMISEPVLWLIITVTVVAFVVFAIVSQFGPEGGFTKYVEFFPTFGGKQPVDGIAIVGIDLEDNSRLKFFDGERWYPVTQENFRIDKKEISATYLKAELENFYFNTQRKGKDYSEANDFKRVYFSEQSPKPLASNDGPYIPLKTSVPAPFLSCSPPEVYTLYIINQEIIPREGEVYSPQIRDAVAWADEILEGNEYEKFLELTYKRTIGGELIEETTKHTVRRVDHLLFVDLNRQVPLGAQEKYLADGYSEEPSVEALNENKFFSLSISFRSDESTYVLFWSSQDKAWTLAPSSHPEFSEISQIFSKHQTSLQDFCSGLNVISHELETTQGKTWVPFSGWTPEGITAYIVPSPGATPQTIDLKSSGALDEDGRIDDWISFLKIITEEYNKGFIIQN